MRGALGYHQNSIVNAVGGRTRLYRDSTSLPGLVTSTVAPNGFTTRASYNSRGHLVASTAEHPYGTGGGAPASLTTTYTWDPLWNAVTRVAPPVGPASARKYNASTGLLEWELTGSDSSRKAHFAHDAKGQLQTITVRDTVIERFWYDDSTGAMHNTRRVENALGVQTELVLDRLGRVTRTYEPRHRDSSYSRSYVRTVYNVMDRADSVVTWGPARSYDFPPGSLVSPDTATVHALTLTASMSYDAEGNQTAMHSYSSGDSDAFVSAVTSYDRLNRVISQTTGSPRAIYYDPAGNVDSLTTPLGTVVRQRHDAIGRVVQRIMPARNYGQEGCIGLTLWPFNGSSCTIRFPYFPNTPSDGYLVSGDTLVFGYDAAGNQIRADNRGARIRRGYWPNGQLRADTTRMSNSWASPHSNSQTRVQTYAYDSAGRVASMLWAGGTTSYEYEDTHTGSLSGIAAPGSTRFRWYFDLWGRDTLETAGTTSQPDRITDRRVYNVAGQLIHRDRRSVGLSGGDNVLADSLTYDHRGKLTRVWTRSRRVGTENYHMRYDGLGAVVASLRARYPAWQLEEFRNDAYGNVLFSRTRSSAHGDNLGAHSEYVGKGHLSERWTPPVSGIPPQGAMYDNLRQMYDSDNLTLTQSNRFNPNTTEYTNYTGSRHYYDGENRLAMVQRYRGFPAAFDPLTGWEWGADGAFEEYRYDALGRRVMTQVRRTGSAPSGTAQLCDVVYSPTSCRGYLEHTWWAGEEMLEESRSAIGASDASNTGTVRYLNGPGLDRPLAIMRNGSSTHVVNYTWRGLGESSLTPTGAAADCSLGNCAGGLINWPAGDDDGVYFREHLGQDDSKALYTWLGSLATNGAGGTTGLLYRRNRYYDSETGRWTQEDPIGIAGGINVFGFAAGDPVNFDDPFGLCPPYDNNLDDCSDEVKRLLSEDPALVEVSNETALVASGFVGLVRGAVGAAFRAAVPRLSANAVPSATNPALQRTIGQLFRPGDRIPGGTAGAIRNEAITGRPTGGTWHLQKGIERAANLRNIMRRQDLSSRDAATARRLLRDLEDAIRFFNGRVPKQ